MDDYIVVDNDLKHNLPSFEDIEMLNSNKRTSDTFCDLEALTLAAIDGESGKANS